MRVQLKLRLGSLENHNSLMLVKWIFRVSADLHSDFMRIKKKIIILYSVRSAPGVAYPATVKS